MNIEDVNRIFQAVRDACDGPTWDHREFMATDSDTPAAARKKYWLNLQVVRRRLREPKTAARTQHRIDFVCASYDGIVAEEISARRQHSTLGCRLLLKTVIMHNRMRAIIDANASHMIIQDFCTHSLLRAFSTRQIERQLRVGVQCGDFISDSASHDARKRIYAPSVDMTFNHWCDLLTEHVVRTVWITTALDLREDWYDAWKTRLGMPTKILDMAYDFANPMNGGPNVVHLADSRGKKMG